MVNGFWYNTPDLGLPRRKAYGKFGRHPSEVRTYKLPDPPASQGEFVSKQNADILRKITRLIIPLIQLPDVMKEWRDQIQIAFQEKPGQKVDTLAKAYFILAFIQSDERWGGLNKIITKELDAKRPENLKIRYFPVDCETYLESVKADLDQKGLLARLEKSEGKSKKPVEIPRIEIQLDQRKLVIGDRQINISSDKVWEFLKELCDSRRYDIPSPTTRERKNARDMLQRIIREQAPQQYKAIWPNLISTSRGKYVLRDSVKIAGGAQVGIRRNRQEK